MDLPELPKPDFDAVLAQLRELSRNHLLVFRVEVGRTVAEAFYDGDVERYRTRASDGSLKDFLAERATELRDLGLEAHLVRKCLLAWQVVSELPPELRPRLVYSHVVELARVEDRSTRLLLAQATLDNGWSGEALKDAIAAAEAGKWIDADPKPGLQPPKAEVVEAPPKKVSVGWAVKRAERSVEDFDAVVDEWERVDVGALSAKQRERALAAASAMRDRAARLVERLKSGV